MTDQKLFPPQQEGRIYLNEGGTETELMYKYGFDLPQFATFPLLDNPKAVSKIREMFRSYLDVVAEHKTHSWEVSIIEQVRIGVNY